MNAFLNPLFLIRISKNYLSAMDRLWRYNSEQIRKYQDRALRNVIKYAYSVPLYNKKYREAGIHPNDIKGINDLKKLPFITKQDLQNNFPKKIITKNFNYKNGFLISTSGSTGKPVFVYIDRFSAIQSLLIFARELKVYGGNWRKSKIALIIDIEPGSAEHTFFSESAVPFIRKFINLRNIKYIHLGEKPEIIIKELDEFKPEFLGSDPNILRQLAELKYNGFGRSVNPRILFSSGSMLDNYTKRYVEYAFDANIFDLYGTTEGGPLGFQCINGNYHIHSDFIYLEFLDEENHPVSNGKPGHVILTKLYGEGTPIIRYDGLDDIAIPIENNSDCGISSQMIKQIEGRTTQLIYLPNGKTLSPLTVTGIPAKVMEKFKSYKIKQFQIIQHKLEKIEVLVDIDNKIDNDNLTREIIKELKLQFSQKIGHNINIIITQTNEIEKDIRLDNFKVIVSKLNQ
jgi:phenylacetate-CoA ligase